MTIKIATSNPNTLATTVGANSLITEAVVRQLKIKILIDSEVEYEFDEAKFKEYFSSSSSKSSSPCKCGNTPSLKEAYSSMKATNDYARHNSSPIKKLSNQGMLTLTKRACQRRRQHQAHQIAKALEQVNGVCYYADLKSMKSHSIQPPQRQVADKSSKPLMKEWIFVKRNHSIIKERIQKRRAHAARRRAFVRKIQGMKRKGVVKESSKSKRVWVPKAKTS